MIEIDNRIVKLKDRLERLTAKKQAEQAEKRRVSTEPPWLASWVAIGQTLFEFEDTTDKRSGFLHAVLEILNNEASELEVPDPLLGGLLPLWEAWQKQTLNPNADTHDYAERIREAAIRILAVNKRIYEYFWGNHQTNEYQVERDYCHRALCGINRKLLRLGWKPEST